jgi:RNA polymerase sigma-70 factor (ECF subfamily)
MWWQTFSEGASMAETQGGIFLRQVRKLVAAHSAARLTDRQLLEQYLARRDESAFAALVQRHGPGVLRLCRSLLHHLQDAEDVFQATFLVLARKAGTIRKHDALGSWLYGVAHRLACKARGRAARRSGQELTAAAEAEAPAVDDMTWRDLQRVLHEELSRLPEKYRAPLLLCYWEGRTQEEAAAQLGWRKGTLKDRVQRARDLLRGWLTRRGVTLSAGLVTALLCERAGTTAEAFTLVHSTTRAALAFAAGNKAVTGGFSAATALAEGVVRAMLLTRVKIAAAVLLTLGLLGAGAGMATQEAPAASAAPQAAKAKPGLARTDKDRIQGVWIPQSMEKGTQLAPKEFLASMKLEFAGDKFLAHGPGKNGRSEEGTYTLRPKSRPKEIDVMGGGKLIPGIYELQGDELKICFTDPGQERPTEFKTAAGSEQVLLILRRQKAAKGAAAPPREDLANETDPAKLRRRIEQLQRELAETREALARTKEKLQQLQAAAELGQREAQAQRAAAEEARRRAEQELQRARAEEDAARRAAAERAAQGGADRERVTKDLKELALAMLNYNDTYKRFPPAAISGKDGKPLLSWRVAILPFLGENDLYKQFKLDEPWDSPHNKKLLARMPRVFYPLNIQVGRGTTVSYFRVFTGPGTIFDGKQGARLQDIRDGTANTLLIVEAAEAVPWTKPDELPYAPGKALPKLGGRFKGGFFAATADGAVHILRTPVDEATLQALITRAEGDIVDWEKLSK